MAKKRKNLVCQYMENVSAAALEKYKDIIRDYIRGRHGIYALYKRDRLYYVGLASNLRGRLNQHLRDRHKGLWDRFSVYLTIESHHIKELESLVLRIAMPTGNRQKGRMARSQDLKKQLEKEVRRRQREELQVLMGKKHKVTKKRTKKAAARRSDSETVLGPYINSSLKLRRTYKGKTYKATVRKNGWIDFNSYLYRSPPGVAKEVCGRAANGWYFW